MTDLTTAIDAFLAKYPDDAPLEFRNPPPPTARRVDPSLTVMVGDLVTAGERHRKIRHERRSDL